MKNLFGEEIKFMLENNFTPKLSILLEAEDDDILGDEEEGGSAEEEGGSEEAPESPAGEGDENVEGDTQDSSTDFMDEKTIEQTADRIDTKIGGISDALEASMINDPVTKLIRDFVNTGINESYNKYSINQFLNEDDSTKKLEKSLDDYETLIQRGADLLDDQDDKRKNINVEKYVEAALHAIKHFNSLFNVFDIVLQSAKTALILDMGGFASKDEKVLEEFEEMLYASVSEETDESFEEYVIDTVEYPTASGAVDKG